MKKIKRTRRIYKRKRTKKLCLFLFVLLLFTGLILYQSSFNNINISSSITVLDNASATTKPTVAPTAEPTAKPTVAPTAEPTAEPTVAPTTESTAEPTTASTTEPTTFTTSDTSKLIAFTFDDGPSKYTQAIMDAIEQYDGHATFFVLGSRISGNERLIAEMYNNGHEIGNHSWNHPNLSKSSYDVIYKQIDDTQEAIYNITGEYPTFMRPPYGAYNSTVKSILSEFDLTMALWTVDTLDWKNRDANAVYNEIMNSTKENSVILLHDLYSTSVEGFIMALETLNEQGYTFVTLSELYST